MSDERVPVVVNLRSDVYQKVKWAREHLFFNVTDDEAIQQIVGEWAVKINE